MPSADAFTLSARVPHKIAEEFKKLADSLGLTPNALIKDMVERAVTGQPSFVTGTSPPQENAEAARAEIETAQLHVPPMYGPALTLIDDLTDAGYPDSEIQSALTKVRREML